MKIATRIVTVLLLSIVALSLSLTAFAEVGKFVQSPSANEAPSVVNSSSEDHKCDESLIVTAYADRSELSEEARAKIEKAYQKINGVKNLTSVCGALKELAAKLGIPTANLAVSDLFDLRDKHTDVEKARFEVSLKAETLENFVGLLHFVDGKWVLVEDAEVSEDKNGDLILTFTTEGLSPFAVVVDTGEEAPINDNTGLIVALVIISVAEAAALITILVKYLISKKTA